MNRVSVCVVVQNEEKNLPRLLESARLVADEMVVVDGGSSDRTQEVARNAGAKVYLRPFTNHADQKNYSASLAAHDWILLLDADEELSGELKESVQEWKNQPPKFAVYEMTRLSWYLGAWIHHSRWYPDWQRRLYRRDKASFSGVIHSALRYDGPVGRLRGDLLHYAFHSFPDHQAKVERYSTAIAREMFDQGQRRWRAAMWFAAPWSWIHHFVVGAGFLDGKRGALIAQMAARGVHLKFRKLGQLVKAERQAKHGGAV
jgi:glycosyltransferase involved in cell wall biosynthesis